MVYIEDHSYPIGMDPKHEFNPRLPKIPDGPINFASKSEYACGMLLERYVPGFEVKTGATFQVGVGHNKVIDFLVNGVFVEYHPITLKFEFDNPMALRKISDGLRRVEPHARREIVEGIKLELAEKYYRRRKFLVSMAAGKNAELICCTNPEEFCKYVVQRFGESAPKLPALLTQFHNLIQRA